MCWIGRLQEDLAGAGFGAELLLLFGAVGVCTAGSDSIV